ncbi:MAG: hypothetical protein IJT97_01345, partial [Bacteroidaceae bacterium]|nr:hypothetical protein [Bacteroidaceae bacterium]
LNDNGGGHNQPFLEKYNQGGLVMDGKRLFELGYTTSCNGTKTTPCLQADIFGDWREELIFFNGNDKTTLNIFTTAHESSARVPCLMLDHTYRIGIAWQNVGYNQPPHLGYYLPDATAARFAFTDECLKMQDVAFGNDMQPVTFHYNNCTGATISMTVMPDGSTVTELPDGFTFEKDARLCNMTLSGRPNQIGTWELVVCSTNSSNGVETTDTILVQVDEATGMEGLDNFTIGQSDNSTYDLQGHRVSVSPASSESSVLPKGVYIQQGRKFIVK